MHVKIDINSYNENEQFPCISYKFHTVSIVNSCLKPLQSFRLLKPNQVHILGERINKKESETYIL